MCGANLWRTFKRLRCPPLHTPRGHHEVEAFPAGCDRLQDSYDWELLISHWERGAGDIPKDAVKRQLLTEETPASIHVLLTLAGHLPYLALLETFMNYMANTETWQLADGAYGTGALSMKMDFVGALTSEKGKGKGTCRRGPASSEYLSASAPETMPSALPLLPWQGAQLSGQLGHMQAHCPQGRSEDHSWGSKGTGPKGGG